MALTFPLSRAEFQQTLRVASVQFHDPVQQEHSGLGGGQVIRADIAPQLWRGTMALAPSRHADAQAVEAMLSRLSAQGTTFFAYDPRRVGPREDPDGSGLSGFSPEIASLAGNNREMSIQGLPVDYALLPGDMLSFEYISAGLTNYGLHRVVTGATAGATGITPLFEVTPAIRPGAATGAAVELVRPYCEAKLLEASYGHGRPVITQGAEFDIVQVLR